MYKYALAFVFSSRYEVFGLHILKDFTCSRPVVLSNASSFPEVAGKTGVYFEPEDKDSISRTVDRVISDKCLRMGMVQKGFDQLVLISWDKMMEKAKTFYRQALAEQPVLID